MSWLEFISSIVKSITWPAVLIAFIFLFAAEVRKMVSNLAERVRSLKTITTPGGASASFEEGILHVKDEANNMKVVISAVDGSQDPVGKSMKVVAPVESLSKLAQASPRGAIVESWVVLEHSIKLLGEKVMSSDSGKLPLVRLINELIKRVEDIQVREALMVARDLMRLRSQAVHEKSFSISSLAAYEFADTAYRIAGILEATSRLIENRMP